MSLLQLLRVSPLFRSFCACLWLFIPTLCGAAQLPANITGLKVEISNQPAADAVCVEAGANGLLDTKPGGDDKVVGNTITTGADGVCNTTANNQNLAPANVPAAADVQAYLNKSTWGNQANIHFTVTRSDHAVNDDLDLNAKLADPDLVSATYAEWDVISAKAKNAGVDYNYYIVDEVEVPFAYTSEARAEATANDSAPAFASVTYILAHETGHLLRGGGHSAHATDLMAGGNISTGGPRIRREEWRKANP